MSSVTKVAIVTGAGSNIGQRTSIALLQEGYSVVLSGRRVEALESTLAEAGEDGAAVAVSSATCWLAS